LLKAALRQRPSFIIVGEIRGAEASVAFQAMQTGHPVLATFHAGSVEKLIQRLTGDPINIPKTYIDILNCVLIQSAVRLPSTGRVERRVLSLNEIVGYDPTTGRFDYIELFGWDAGLDQHVFRGEGSSYLLEKQDQDNAWAGTP
jgi:flagellar protein FlaI